VYDIVGFCSPCPPSVLRFFSRAPTEKDLMFLTFGCLSFFLVPVSAFTLSYDLCAAQFPVFCLFFLFRAGPPQRSVRSLQGRFFLFFPAGVFLSPPA